MVPGVQGVTPWFVFDCRMVRWTSSLNTWAGVVFVWVTAVGTKERERIGNEQCIAYLVVEADETRQRRGLIIFVSSDSVKTTTGDNCLCGFSTTMQRFLGWSEQW